MINSNFKGLHEEMYDFFWQISFQNNKSFFTENHKQYVEHVRKPLLELAAVLSDTVHDIDSGLNTYPPAVLSRINRDIRYTKDKSPYRNHLWLGYKYNDDRTGDSFCLYAEFNRDSYGYGMGMYCPNTELMQKIRSNILLAPGEFLDLIDNSEFKRTFTIQGESYKKEKYHHESERITRWLNLKYFYFEHSSDDLKATTKPEVADEIKNAFQVLKPVYQFLIRSDASQKS